MKNTSLRLLALVASGTVLVSCSNADFRSRTNVDGLKAANSVSSDAATGTKIELSSDELSSQDEIQTPAPQAGETVKGLSNDKGANSIVVVDMKETADGSTYGATTTSVSVVSDGGGFGAGNLADAGANSTSNGGSNSVGSADGNSTGEVGAGTNPSNLRWMAMGDQPLAQLLTIPECTSNENIARSACSNQNATCRGKFSVTCDTSSDCRRLFKCTTGTSTGLMWFAMGDTTSSGTFPQCAKTSNIAGSECSVQNDLCLSQFLTATGNPRLFKCLPSGGSGLLFWRWIEDKSAADLASIGKCSVRENVAGTSCFSENSRCKSQFCVQGVEPNCSKLRLFKCTP